MLINGNWESGKLGKAFHCDGLGVIAAIEKIYESKKPTALAFPWPFFTRIYAIKPTTLTIN